MSKPYEIVNFCEIDKYDAKLCGRTKSGGSKGGGVTLDEVKRCPFCGGAAKLMGGKVYTIPESDSNGAYVDADIEVEPSWVECQSCHAEGPTFDETDEGPENAVAAWNRRIMEK